MAIFHASEFFKMIREIERIQYIYYIYKFGEKKKNAPFLSSRIIHHSERTDILYILENDERKIAQLGVQYRRYWR